MKKQRKHYTPEEKVAILRRHLLDKEPISKLCDELGLWAHRDDERRREDHLLALPQPSSDR